MIFLGFWNKVKIRVKHILCTEWNISIDTDQGFFRCFSDKVSWHYKIASSLGQKNCILPKHGYYLNMMIRFPCHSILWETSVSSLWLSTESQHKFSSKAACPEPQTGRLWEKHSDPTVLSQAGILQQQWHAPVSWQQIIPEYLSCGSKM